MTEVMNNDLVPEGLILVGNRWLTPQERQDLWKEQEADNHYLACPRYPVAKLQGLIPQKFLLQLQENEKLKPCCRRPIEHDIEAFYSSAKDRDQGVPDIYVLHCTCGRKHRRFMLGGSVDPGSGEVTHPRPFWEVR